MHWVDYSPPSLMPGPPSDQTDSSSPSWKKRKRDHENMMTFARPPSSFFGDCPNRENNSCSMPLAKHPMSSPMEGGDLSCRARCLPRKRRHLHPLLNPTKQPPQQQQQHFDGLQYPSHSATTPTRLPSSHSYASTVQDVCSPPVSPKTLVPISYPSTSASALRPCHICHRRPTTWQVLDAYADCDLCGERACYICLRQCDGLSCAGSAALDAEMDEEGGRPHHHDAFDGGGPALRRKVCSSCAIEGVTETGVEIVRCFDCVRDHSGPWTTESLGVDWVLDGVRHESMSG